MSVSNSLAAGLDAKIVDGATNERPFLIFVFVLMYVSYGALGRDVFYNHLNAVTLNDPIGAVLPFIRVAACAVAVAVVVLSAGLTWALSKVPLLFAPFCFLALASAAWSAEPKEVARNALVLIAMWVAMPMVIHRLGLAQTVRTSIHVVAVVVIASAFLAIAVPSIGRHSGLEVVQFSHVGRWRGIFSHKNGLGPWAAYGSVFLFTHSWLCKGPRLYWWTARASALACLIFAGSATGVIAALFLSLLWLIFMALRRYRFSVVITTLIVGAIPLLIAAYALQDVVFSILGRDPSLTGRTAIWALAYDYFWNRPFFGNGFQGLGGPEFLDFLLLNFKEALTGPESGYLTLLLELGIVGFLCFFIPFFLSIRNGFRWLNFVTLEDRAGIEFYLMTLLSTLVISLTESSAIISTSFDGVIAFAGFFALLTAPKAPKEELRADFRLAQYAA